MSPAARSATPRAFLTAAPHRKVVVCGYWGEMKINSRTQRFSPREPSLQCVCSSTRTAVGAGRSLIMPVSYRSSLHLSLRGPVQYIAGRPLVACLLPARISGEHPACRSICHTASLAISSAKGMVRIRAATQLVDLAVARAVKFRII